VRFNTDTSAAEIFENKVCTQQRQQLNNVLNKRSEVMNVVEVITKAGLGCR
jgi:hypothetical protein